MNPKILIDLRDWGWDDFFSPHRREEFTPARVVAEYQNIYGVVMESGESLARVTGGFRHRAAGPEDFPAVGDWVHLQQRPGEDQAIIHGVFPRRTKFSRRAPGANTEEQVIAANIDLVLIVDSLAEPVNLRRIERYLATAARS
jgi:ribosome biogenesis GTPase